MDPQVEMWDKRLHIPFYPFVIVHFGGCDFTRWRGKCGLDTGIKDGLMFATWILQHIQVHGLYRVAHNKKGQRTFKPFTHSKKSLILPTSSTHLQY